MEPLLQGRIRDVSPEDRKKLRTFSFSKLDVFNTCPYQYDLKYNKKNYPEQKAIHLDLGVVAHYILQRKAECIMKHQPINYNELYNLMDTGAVDIDPNGKKTTIIGIPEIKKKFGFEAWFEPDNKSGMNYEEKIKLFKETVLINELPIDDKWQVFGAELPVGFVYKYGETEDGSPLEIILQGSIDCVYADNLEHPTKFKIVDYKTGKKKFEDKDVVTSLQQSIYGLHMYNTYGVLPSEYEYRFVFINETQKANTLGYLKRVLTKMDKLMSKIDEGLVTGAHQAKPTPLCNWCQFKDGAVGSIPPYSQLCEYYSLWTPDNKTFAVNKPWSPETALEQVGQPKPKRRLDF